VTTSGTTNTNSYQFTGRENDGSTGLYFYRARYYNPTFGRFIAEDPLGLHGGSSNLYKYASDSPIMATDAEGTSTCASLSAANTIEDCIQERELHNIVCRQKGDDCRAIAKTPEEQRICNELQDECETEVELEFQRCVKQVFGLLEGDVPTTDVFWSPIGGVSDSLLDPIGISTPSAESLAAQPVTQAFIVEGSVPVGMLPFRR